MHLILFALLAAGLLHAEPPEAPGEARDTPAAPLCFGVETALDALWGTGATSDGTSKGLGLGIGVAARYTHGTDLRITLSPGFHSLQVSKVISNATYSQTAKYLGLKLIGAYNVGANPIAFSRGQEKPRWWLDGGFELMLPMSAIQNQGGTESTLTAGTNFAAIVGTSLDWRLSEKFLLSANLRGFITLTNATSRIVGLGVGAGFYFQ